MTPWFNGAVKPVREGVYETQHGYQWYSPHSATWFGYHCKVVGAQDLFIENFKSSFQAPTWRGFTEKQ